MNKVCLTGRITKDVELRQTQNQNQCVMFTIAVDRTYKDAQGQRQADFISCVAWNNQAEFLSRYVKKGNMLAITGAIQTRSYQTQQNETRVITEVIVDGVENLTPRESQPQQQQQPKPNQHQPYGQQNQYNQPQFDVQDEDLPF